MKRSRVESTVTAAVLAATLVAWPAGSAGATPVQASVGQAATVPGSGGYRLVAGDGGVFGEGASFYGSGAGHESSPVVGAASTVDGGGYWIVTASGQVSAFGDAPDDGSVTVPLDAPIVGMAADPVTGGYWLVAADGGVFSFAAAFHGSLGAVKLARPITGIAADVRTGGYWLVAADGGVFSFDAPFDGSAATAPLAAPVIGIAADPDTGGYWLAGSDGGVFSYGAPFRGSAAGTRLSGPVVGIAADAVTGGYLLGAADGGVFSFGAPFEGSQGGTHLLSPIVAVTAPTEAVPTCTATDLATTVGPVAGGLGHFGFALIFTNTSAAACTLSGYPAVTLGGAAGGSAVRAADTPSGYLGGLETSTVPPTVTLAPGVAASALLEGTDDPPAGKTGCVDYPTAEVTAPGETLPTTVAFSVVQPGTYLPGCSTPQIHPIVIGTTGSQ